VKPLKTFLTALWLLAMLSTCENKINHDEAPKPSPLILKNLSVTFAPYAPASGRAGDFIFDARYQKVFYEFGVKVAAVGGGTKVLAEFTYNVDSKTVVRAPAAGYITGVHDQEGRDYEIWIQPQPENAIWMLVIDHISNPLVKVGQAVQAGDPLGNPGPWDANLGRVEIMLVNQQEKAYYAPFAQFDPALSEPYQNQVWQLMREWEHFKGDTTLYDQTTMKKYYAGCLNKVYYE